MSDAEILAIIMWLFGIVQGLVFAGLWFGDGPFWDGFRQAFWPWSRP